MRNHALAGLTAVLAPLVLAACGSDASDGDETQAIPITKIDRSHLKNLGTAPLDYADPNLWLCRPGNDPNECYRDLDATETLKNNSLAIVHRTPALRPSFDCFYVYPTVSLGVTGNVTDFSDITLILDPLLSQAAPFRSLCEVYAPLYRQASIGGGSGGISLSGDLGLAYADVEAAFQYYLDHLSGGRNFVLVGHSQGTYMLTQLIDNRLDTDPALRSRMISALLIGGSVIVPAGQRVGGSFQSVPTCARAGETGCVIAYNSYAREAPPGESALFGRAPEGSEIACTTPGVLANNPGRLLGSYLPLEIQQPLFVPDGFPEEHDFTTPYGLYRDFFRGECVTKDGAQYLEISIDKTPDDQRPVPPYRSATIEAIGFGLHIADYNLPLDDLLRAVGLQAAAK